MTFVRVTREASEEKIVVKFPVDTAEKMVGRFRHWRGHPRAAWQALRATLLAMEYGMVTA